MLRVPAPTVVILAAGRARACARAPKPLHASAGGRCRLAVRAALEAGRRRVVVVDGPAARLEGELPDGVELAVQDEPRHRPRGALRRAPDRRRGHRDRARRRRAAHHRGGDRRARARARGERRGRDDGDDGARRPDRLRARRARRRRLRRARRRDQDAGRRDPRGAGDPRGQHRHLRLRRAARCSTRSAGSAPTTPRASSTCPTCCRSCAPTASRRRPRRHDPTLTLGVNDRVDLARVRELAQPRIHRAHMLAGVTIVDPRDHADRRRRRDRPRHRGRAVLLPARRHARSASAARSAR